MADGVTPYLKLSLKSKILLRRQEKGLNDIKVDFTPRPSYPMTDEEKRRDEKRRSSNRRSAQKSRKKQRQQWKDNEKELLSLKDKQKTLSKDISQLETEKSSYLSMLMKYIPESKINAILEETVDYETLRNTPETMMHTSEDMDKDSDNSSSFVADVIEMSSISFLSDLELSNDSFVQSNYHDAFINVESATESIDIDGVIALGILNSVGEENS